MKRPTRNWKKTRQQVTRKLVSILSRLKDEGKISRDLYSHLYATSEKVPQMYCLPKVHKEGIPFRPIVDYIGSIGYNTSRFLADILAPIIGKTQQFVKNSKHLSNDIANLHLQEDEILLSHDVVSLFTNIPVTDSLLVIRDRLETKDNFRSRWCNGTFGIHIDDHIFQLPWPNLQTKIWHRHEQSSFPTSGKFLHGAFRR